MCRTGFLAAGQRLGYVTASQQGVPNGGFE
jgi:hypothetical protein